MDQSNKIQHLIMGTAGHIDHGKTSLIKALTGVDCDTHKEEKERGITIHLGFSHLEIEQRISIGIVDMPGHASFIRTMVSGAFGIDFFLIVIAADSGVMPQTYEHLQIMQILGIKKGIIAITKIDLVDDEIMLMLNEEIDILKDDYPLLKELPIKGVSSKTGEGIENLKNEIIEISKTVKPRNVDGLFRMFIDRIFTIKGFGTVVTGSVSSGQIHKDDNLYILPSEKKLRIRRLEQHGSESEYLYAGDRASINLVGLSLADFKRGMQLTDRILTPTDRIDAKISLFKQCHPVGIWFEAILLIGTYEAQVKIHCLNTNHATGGNTILTQVHLPTSCAIQAGDKFILRSTSNDLTLGGGEVIDPFPLNHRRRPEKLLKEIEKISAGELPTLISLFVKKQMRVVDGQYIADSLNCSFNDVHRVANEKKLEDVQAYYVNNNWYFLIYSEYEKWKSTIVRKLHGTCKKSPLKFTGFTTQQMLGLIGQATDEVAVIAFDEILKEVEMKGDISRNGSHWLPTNFEQLISPELKNNIKMIDTDFRRALKNFPRYKDLIRKYSNLNIKETLLSEIINHLVSRNRLIPLESTWMHRNVMVKHATKLLNHMYNTPQGTTVADARDILETNRDICLKLYSYTDQRGYTLRDGDYRTVSSEGMDWIKKFENQDKVVVVD